MQALLLYTPTIKVPLIIEEPSQIDKNLFETLKRMQWEDLPSTIDLAESTISPEISTTYKSYFPALTTIKLETQSILYPQLISMIHGDTINYLKYIDLKSIKPVTHLSGVMHFIRDALLDVGGRETKKVFVIDKLTGTNDISPLLELSRAVKGKMNERNPLELIVEKYIKQLREEYKN